MKNIYSISFTILSAIAFSLFFYSCHDGTNPAPEPGSLLFHLHTLTDTTEVDNYGDTLVLSDGRKITVTTAQLYLSNIKLIKADGSILDGPSINVFMKQGTEEYDLGNVPSGNYKTVRFDVGLSDSTNTATPISSDAILYQPSMWFGAIAQPDGFVFVNFQGTVDTTDAANGTALIPFAYKIGTSAHRVTVTMPDQNYTVVPGEQTVIHMTVKYATLLEGIQLNDSSNLSLLTAQENTWAWVDQMETKIVQMFEYE